MDPMNRPETVPGRDRTPGALKLYLGYAPGVGATYSMLQAARQAASAGADVVAGFIDPTSRRETLELARTLEQLPRLECSTASGLQPELDLDGALARAPEILLVDDLAHTNSHGCRHGRRYQDVEELLAAGIQVWATVRLQDLESLQDVVESITGIPLTEHIPDAIFDSAAQVEMVDPRPQLVLERLGGEETVYPEKTLTSLRDLALHRVEDRLAAVPGHKAKRSRSSREHILVCLSGSPSNAKVVRTAGRMARAFHGSFTAIFVETPDFPSMPDEGRSRVDANARLAEELGASVTISYGSDPAIQIAEYARISGATKLVLGRSPRKRRLIPSRDLVDRLNDLSPDLDIYIIPDQRAARHLSPPADSEWAQERLSLADFGKMLAVLVLCTLGGFLFTLFHISDINISMLYILGVLIISMVTVGRLYSLLASGLSVLVFNFFFTHPYFSFLSDPSYIATFGIMFVVAILSSSMTTKIKSQAKQNADKAYRTAILLESSQKLQKEEGSNAILTTLARQLNRLLERDLVLYPTDSGGQLLSPIPFPFSEGTDLSALMTETEAATARWVLQHNKHAGATTRTMPDAQCLYMAIRGTEGVLAVAGIAIAGVSPLVYFEKNLMVALLDECGLALEKDRTIREKQAAEEQAHQEALRANLLRAISHDLRTPLTSISGNASILLEGGEQLSGAKRRNLYSTIYEDSMWLINLVENLLSITRIEDGRLNVSIQPELLDDVFSEAMSHLDRSAGQHRIQVDLPDDMLMAEMDARLVVQVIINLVNNAIKYTPAGSQITLSAHRQGSLAVVEVTDDGPGIPTAAKEKLFDMFYTANNERGDGRRGLGLGLALCKSIVTAHGGTIKAVDHLPHGTTFRFTLRASEVNAYE